MRPVIGVTVSRRSGWRIFPLMALSVRLAGGRAKKWKAMADVRLDEVDGIVIGGGDDIAPTLYGGELRVGVRLDPARDAMEKAVLEAAFERGIPVLGICRGAQMLNIVLGGTLFEDAYDVYGVRNIKTILPRKRVNLEKGSLVARTIRKQCLYVNALHSQAVDKVGQDIRVAGRDPSGMVQAIERTRDPFAIGVQWHPEHLFYRPAHRRLFKSLVAAARARMARAAQLGAAEEAADADFAPQVASAK